MQITLGIVFVLWWLLYLGQLVSVVNLPLAQRLGLQEKPGAVDPLVTRLELGTARWDLVSLWVLPMAGVLMLIDHGWWPVFALIGGGIFVDAGGREAVKLSALRQHGVPIGTPKELRLAMAVYAVLVIVGGLGVGAGVVELSGYVSSVMPSQSSSTGVWSGSVGTSSPGTTSPRHAPQSVPSVLQVSRPLVHAPTLTVPGGPV